MVMDMLFYDIIFKVMNKYILKKIQFWFYKISVGTDGEVTYFNFPSW